MAFWKLSSGGSRTDTLEAWNRFLTSVTTAAESISNQARGEVAGVVPGASVVSW